MATARSVFPKPLFIGASVRSPIGRFGGSLAHLPAGRLAALTLKEALKRAPGAPTDFVLMGHARQAGAGPNPARQATIFAGLPESVPATTLNQACASGITAIISACEKIALGKAHNIWAGGVESMSNTPYLLPKARWGQKMGNMEVVDGMYQDGFHCPMADMVMGATVETFLAKEMGISRKEQDEYALRSQQRAAESVKNGLFKNESFVIAPEGKLKGLDHDEHARADTTMESLAKLPPVFDAKAGSVTAGNASGITDGAAFLQISDTRHAFAEAEIIDYEVCALDPRRMGLGPIECTQKLLQRQGLTVNDLAAVEINEAFAAQVIACNRALKIPEDKLNARGGSIALGHPIGATGARITVTLLSQLKGKPGALGLATLCVSGGQGVAILIRAL